MKTITICWADLEVYLKARGKRLLPNGVTSITRGAPTLFDNSIEFELNTGARHRLIWKVGESSPNLQTLQQETREVYK